MGRRRRHYPAQADGPVRLRRLGQAERPCRTITRTTTIAARRAATARFGSFSPASRGSSSRSARPTSLPSTATTTPASNPGKTVGASINFWQGGIIQNIEAADTSLYFVYQHADGYILGNARYGSRQRLAPTGKNRSRRLPRGHRGREDQLLRPERLYRRSRESRTARLSFSLQRPLVWRAAIHCKQRAS